MAAIEKLPLTKTALNEDLLFILGRPNFACARTARRLRAMGHECAFKAEAEQALVIHAMLSYYNEYGPTWRTELEQYLKPQQS